MGEQVRVTETIRLGTALAFSGGFLDAYTFMTRGGTFANAETGNVVRVGINMALGNYRQALFYLVPVIAFAVGVFASVWFRERMNTMEKVHWKEGVLLVEILVLCIAGLLPQQLNAVVTCSIAFVCALQSQTFRKMRGMAFATTMCTGNLRSGTELLTMGSFEQDSGKKQRGLWYYWIDVTFAIGGAAGAFLSRFFAERAVWFSAAILVGVVIFIEVQKKKGEV